MEFPTSDVELFMVGKRFIFETLRIADVGFCRHRIYKNYKKLTIMKTHQYNSGSYTSSGNNSSGNKRCNNLSRNKKRTIGKLSAACLMYVGLLVPGVVNGQNSVPPPGGGFGGNSLMRPGNSVPAPGGFGQPGGGPAFGPAVRPVRPPRPVFAPSIWNAPWGGVTVQIGNTSPGWENNGVTNILCCGYDAQGVWRSMPLRISYNWNGVSYNVTVLNAWNPWTNMWDVGVDMPAYSTSYYLNGVTYNYYAPLSTGTYYFNL